MTEFVVKDMLTVKNIVGQLDQNINLIMEKLDVKISISDDTFKIDGENSEIAKNVLMVLSKKSKNGDVDLNDISYIIDLARDHR